MNSTSQHRFNTPAGLESLPDSELTDSSTKDLNPRVLSGNAFMTLSWIYPGPTRQRRTTSCPLIMLQIHIKLFYTGTVLSLNISHTTVVVLVKEMICLSVCPPFI